MKNYTLKIFSDFDGTISKNDVWINALGKFIKDKEAFNKICTDYTTQRITTRECCVRQLELMSDFSYEKFDSYLDEEGIDEHFPDFVKFCSEMNYELRVVSGGLDYYISYILNNNGLDIKTYACKMNYDKVSDKVSCEFEHTDEYCNLCETCKRNILINNTNDLDGEISVYIGDGVSDYCVSGHADIVFAKGTLASYCWKNNITYFDYKNFSDIKNKLIKITGSNKIRQRQEARIRRRDVVMGG
ncbi:MAG: HAD-IB family phosphatase [bacterium]|nr:HAD-IB family phosphatase [bacterium]